MKKAWLILFLIGLLTACVQKKIDTPATSGLDLSRLKGTGSFTFSSYLPLQNKPVQVYYHIPNGATANTPILIAFHGTERSGQNTRNYFSNLSKDAIILAPEFSESLFPGGDAYNLGNVYADGDNPSQNTLNPEAVWTYSIVEPLFEYVKSTLQSKVSTYDVFGHSAGAQFAQRLILFKPSNSIHQAVISAAGWYTLLDTSIGFPYGTKNSIAANYTYAYQFKKSIFIIVGEKDTDPNAADLRRNDLVDVQGTNRLARANFFYTHSRNIALKENNNFNWKYQIIKNSGHDYAMAAAAGASLLYP